LRSGPEQPPLSVSIGVSVYPDDGRSAQDLLEAATGNYTSPNERRAVAALQRGPDNLARW
jgi:hypothetical protein